jgi:hypothetical protein
VLISAPCNYLLAATKRRSLDGDTWLNFDAFQSFDAHAVSATRSTFGAFAPLTRKRDSGQGTKRGVQRSSVLDSPPRRPRLETF